MPTAQCASACAHKTCWTAYIFLAKLKVALNHTNKVLAKVFNRLPLRAEEIAEEYLDSYAPRLRPHIDDTVALIHKRWNRTSRCCLKVHRPLSLTLITARTRSSHRPIR